MTTRRSILAGLALPAALTACHPAVPAAHPRFAADHPDAELFDLERRWGPADTAYTAAAEREEALEHVGLPPRPAALSHHDSDSEVGLNQLAVQDRYGDVFYFVIGEEGATLRRPHTRIGLVPIPPGDRLYAPGRMMTGRVPWPERQARADEIVAAWDRWKAEERAAQEASGHTAAKEEAGRLARAAAEIERAIEAATPRTLDGLAVKARLLREHIRRGWEIEDFAATVAGDILRLAGDVA